MNSHWFKNEGQQTLLNCSKSFPGKVRVPYNLDIICRQIKKWECRPNHNKGKHWQFNCTGIVGNPQVNKYEKKAKPSMQTPMTQN